MKLPLLLLAPLAPLIHSATTPSDTTLAGHHVIWSYPGPTIPQTLTAATLAGKVGGIIFFGENVSANLSTQIANLQTAYKSSPAYAGVPLLILTDQEGGKVNRLPGGPAQSAKQVGMASDPAGAGADAGATIARVLGGYNTNGDLAPVVDVFRQAGDFIDEFGRSYGNTSGLVSTCIGPLITSLQASGIAATAKHFPGLGAAPTDANTDAKPVTINTSLAELRAVDEAPYVTAIAKGVKMVMASWVVYPALDGKYPSGLSAKWIRGELRGRLGFEGVTITDALEAGSLEAFGETAQRAVLAVGAGMDVLLAAARNVTQGSDAVKAIVDGLKQGTLDRANFTTSTQRILDLRKTLPKV